jgi:hypothetical protein
VSELVHDSLKVVTQKVFFCPLLLKLASRRALRSGLFVVVENTKNARSRRLLIDHDAKSLNVQPARLEQHLDRCWRGRAVTGLMESPVRNECLRPLGLELGLVEGLSLGKTDSLGWIDGVVVGWSVGWFDFIDGMELINLTLANDRTIEGHPSNAKALHMSGSQCFAD